MNEMRILSPTAILGYGFPEESFFRGMKEKPHVVAVDAGSTDPGPYYLGSGESFTDRNAVKRDLSLIIQACIRAEIPTIIGSCGGSGARPHLDWTVGIVQEIARETGLNFKIAVIAADVAKETVLEKFRQGQIQSMDNSPPLDAEAIQQSEHIVAQMGMEPIIQALNQGAQVILAGRAYDPAVFAALPVKQGYDKGLAVHLGKILECASIAASPGSGSDCMMGYLGRDYFKIKPLNPIRKCTIVSVSAHTLYEKSDPYYLPGPGGILDLSAAQFMQEDDSTVKVTGSQYEPRPYALKLEAARKIGYRTIAIAGTVDPILISRLDEIIAGVKSRTLDNFKDTLQNYYLDFKVYGINGVSLFPASTHQTEALAHSTVEHKYQDAVFPPALPAEIGIVIDAVAETQEAANTLCSFARSTMLHFGYTGRISTAGNLAFPFSPSDLTVGPVYEFSLYHLVESVDPLAFFPVTIFNSL